MKINEIEKKLSNWGIKRDPHFNVGKKVGNDIWVHKNYAKFLLSDEKYNKFRKQLPDDFYYNLLRVNLKKDDVAFIHSPDFDKANEPTVGEIWRIYNDEDELKTKHQKPVVKNPLIYHHKWLFVGDDYRGFDVNESKIRSYEWKSILGVDKNYSSRIGRKNFWEKWLEETKVQREEIKQEQKEVEVPDNLYYATNQEGLDFIRENGIDNKYIESDWDEKGEQSIKLFETPEAAKKDFADNSGLQIADVALVQVETSALEQESLILNLDEEKKKWQYEEPIEFKNVNILPKKDIQIENFIKRKESELSDVWAIYTDNKISQEVDSAKTARLQKPRTLSFIKSFNLSEENNVILDIGCGSGNEYNKNELESMGFSYNGCDPFNKSTEQNMESIKNCHNGKSDIVTLNNVLNTINEKEVRKNVLMQAENALKDDSGLVLIITYEGEKTQEEKNYEKEKNEKLKTLTPVETRDGWQNRMKTERYLSEVEDVFPNVKLINNNGSKVIVASKDEYLDLENKFSVNSKNRSKMKV